MTFPVVGKQLDNMPKKAGACGDNYGIGNKAKIGKVRDSTVGYIPVSKKKLQSPPRSVV